jgi:PST family polysaccharide transporter
LNLFDRLSKHLQQFLTGDRKRVLENIFWLLIDRGLRIILGIIVGVWLARHLGPTDFGTLSYAIAFMAMLNSLVTLGLEDIVVQDLIRSPNHTAETLGTTFYLQVSAGIVTAVIAYALLYWLRTDDVLVRHIAAILSLGFILQSTNMIRYWYQAQVLAKKVVRIQIAALVIASLLRILCILLAADVSTFAWLIVVESAMVSIGLSIKFYSESSNTLKSSFKLALRLLRDSWPLILSGIAVVTYMRIDQVMLGSLEDDHAVGIYAAALTVSEAWYFVPMAIVASVFPGIIQSKRENESAYLAKTQMLLSTLFLMSLTVAGCFSLTSVQLVKLLYGHTFSEAADVLQIHAWAGIFVAIGLASGRWFINEGLQILQFYKTLAGAITNILLNLVLIPKYGGTGAAVATLISFGVAAYISDSFFAATRPMFFMKTRAILLQGLINNRRH